MVKAKKVKKSAKKTSHHCPTCRQTTTKDGHLCVPIMRGDAQCDWCGSLIADQRHLCNDKIRELSYICNSCGRTAVSAAHLCSPQKVR
ncbi:MAG TPA: hypothetical protein PL155_01365 [Candidatus Omnitrophota bacterium]|nr:hypothetical protein [Candidatus Omnitrophota bacterium]HPD84864.1 hypothetical protein [Candidatus Omnitrophota bacterium]HRZ03722.1 hypothetical protein [Candidatus Omnitrophota bacterium]